MIKMVVAQQKIIYIPEYIGIDRQLTTTAHKRDIAEHGIKHQALASELHEKRVMPQPHQRIFPDMVQRMQILRLGIPFFTPFFFPLGIHGKTPFQDIPHPGPHPVLPVDKTPPHHRIPLPVRFYSNQSLVPPKRNMFTHFSSPFVLQKYIFDKRIPMATIIKKINNAYRPPSLRPALYTD